MWPYLKPAYTQATRMVAPVAVRASRLGGGSLPTGFVESMEEAATTTGGRCLTVRPPEMITRTVPRGHPDHSDDYVPWLSEHVRRVAVAELPHGRVLSPHSAVITANDDLVVEVSLYFGTSRAREHPIFLHPFSGLPLEVGGRLGVLALQGDANYYHFFMDVLPRLGVLERCPAIAPPDLWYVPTAAPFQRELLEMMGLDLTRVVDSSQHRHVVAETLVVPSPPAMTLINPPWSVEYLRSKLLPGPITRVEGKGIYVQRGGGINNRCVLNEADLVDYLDGRGFTILPESLPARAKIEAFAQTSGRPRRRVPLRTRPGRPASGVGVHAPGQRHRGGHPRHRTHARRPRLAFLGQPTQPDNVARTAAAVRCHVNSDACFTPRSRSSALWRRASGTARARADASQPSITVASPPVTSKSAGSGVTTTGMPRRMASSAGRPKPS
jgi:hypothetical protein